MEAWNLLVTLAATQWGVVGRQQLLDLGVTIHHLDTWASTARIERVAPRVWRVAGAPDTWEQRLQIGLLSLGDHACVSHSAAGQLHGFDRTPADRVEFLVPRTARTTRIAGPVVHSTGVLPTIDICRVGGFRATSATRTIIDLARARVPRVRLEAAIDSAVRSGASAPVVLHRRLSALRGRGRWGCRLLDELLLDSGGETLLERRFLRLVRRGGLPRPKVQVPFRDGQRTAARVDFLFEEYLIVVEVSGRKGHSSPAERAKDAQRRNELQDLGYVVIEYTWEHVTQREPWVLATMRERLISRGWLP
jgi:very-short-patch-repair endonuclease